MVDDGRRFALVVDDEQIVRTLVKEFLESRNFRVEVARDAFEARAILEGFEPDIVIIDLDLGPGPSGADLAHFAAKKYPHLVRLVLSKYPDIVTSGIPEASLPSGTSFLSKEKVADQKVLSKSVDSALAEKPVFVTGVVNPRLEGLTAQQLRLVRLMAQGYTTAEIARQRERTLGAIEKMATTLYKHLELDAAGSINPRTEAVRVYCQAFGTPARSNNEKV